MDHKKKITAVLFLSCLFLFPAAAVMLPDKSVSKTERRSLEQMPKLSLASLMDGSYGTKLETYFLDQFPGRDIFRSLKAETEIRILGKEDSDGYYRAGDGIYKLETDTKEKNITRAAEKIEQLITDHFGKANCYYAIIPDKSVYLTEHEDYPVIDEEKVQEIFDRTVSSAEKIGLKEQLELADYYRTDLHWKQERLDKVASYLAECMEIDMLSMSDEYAKTATDHFYGAYAAASAFVTAPDTICYYEDDVIRNMSVYDYEKQEMVSVYAPERLGQTDDYDFYLWGARALLTIQNPQCHNGRRLLLFRDSFGSSIAPLLARGYEEVTLVDLRYVSADYALQLLGDTEYEDVLFLYSASILNHGDTLRF